MRCSCNTHAQQLQHTCAADATTSSAEVRRAYTSIIGTPLTCSVFCVVSIFFPSICQYFFSLIFKSVFHKGTPLTCSAFCVNICTFYLVKQVNWVHLEGRQYLYFCTRKESKLSTSEGASSAQRAANVRTTCCRPEPSWSMVRPSFTCSLSLMPHMRTNFSSRPSATSV
jgi:hypothetical protein